jgi:uncharacterized protein YdiU (UPF0061 family)
MSASSAQPLDLPHDVPSHPGGWRLDHSYSRLPSLLSKPCLPTPVSNPQWVVLNRPLAAQLGLDPDSLALPHQAALLSGNTLPPGAQPIAQAYAGHQFGHFTVLGDGRALLLGEQITPEGARLDLQLKGPGRTPFSRGGDGRAALGPMLREYLLSEAMHALGIPTTRSLAVVATGDPVFREETLPGAILTRIASSHIRVGTFEWLALQQDLEATRALTRYTLQRHSPERLETDNPALQLLEFAAEKQASLLAQWMHVGFVHGVMNTDNMALCGETIDYGPCAFLDHFDPDACFSSIDRGQRYAFSNQPRIAQWNLARLAEALLPLLHPNPSDAVETATALLHRFLERFQTLRATGLRQKLGLYNEEPEDPRLAQRLLDWMHQQRADHTLTFRSLSSLDALQTPPFPEHTFVEWHQSWKARRLRQPQSPEDCVRLMQRSNPSVMARNHLVEEALQAASESQDLRPFQKLLEVVQNPFADPTSLPQKFLEPRPSDAPPYRTFCGT